jgi:hypothetical protein
LLVKKTLVWALFSWCLYNQGIIIKTMKTTCLSPILFMGMKIITTMKTNTNFKTIVLR